MYRANGPQEANLVWRVTGLARSANRWLRAACGRLKRLLVGRRLHLPLFLHLAILALAYHLAFALRFDFAIPQEMTRLLWRSLPWVLPVQLAIFYRFGSLHGWWRYVTLTDLASLLQASTVSTLSVASIDYFLVTRYQIPRAVLLLDWGLTILLLGGVRSARRLLWEEFWPRAAIAGRRPALMIYAGHGSEAVVRQIHAHPKLEYRIIGFLDGNQARHGSRLGGIPFLGSPEEAVALARGHQVQDLLVIANSIPGPRLRNVAHQCHEAGIRVKIIPAIDELVTGSYRVQIRDVNIDDLLRRDPVKLDSQTIGKMLRGNRVMVTGAGGSIGSEICRQVVKCHPERLILVERAENSLFSIERELNSLGLGRVAACIADIGDAERMRTLFRTHEPHIVFHAAAHKHVPLMEGNPGEAIKNNVFGTRKLADLSREHGVDRFVLISTDKAVKPTSVMGVSKQIAERYVHALTSTSRTRYIVVRFGNVLASAGSVVPIFQEQIRRGGPITVTHPAMERFFMTIPEASQLVLQAAAMGNGGEMFVLDMGEPVKIVDLAKDLIRLSGFAVDEIDIVFTGLRPGEKLTEELHFEHEELRATSHPKVMAAHYRPFSLPAVLASILELEDVVQESSDVIRAALRKIAAGYSPDDRSDVAQRAAAASFEPILPGTHR